MYEDYKVTILTKKRDLKVPFGTTLVKSVTNLRFHGVPIVVIDSEEIHYENHELEFVGKIDYEASRDIYNANVIFKKVRDLLKKIDTEDLDPRFSIIVVYKTDYDYPDEMDIGFIRKQLMYLGKVFTITSYPNLKMRRDRIKLTVKGKCDIDNDIKKISSECDDNDDVVNFVVKDKEE